MTDSRATFSELLVTTKDGDWGKSEPTEGHVPYFVIRGTDFQPVSTGEYSSVPLRYLPERTVERRTLKANDILIETAGGSKDRPTGRTMLVTEATLAGFNNPVTCASFARMLRVNPRKADPRFVYWFLQYLYASGQIEQFQVQHTGVARFQFTQFASSQQVPLPEFVEQRAIAEVLGALDDKIAANRKLVSLADELALTLVRSRLSASSTVAVSDVALVTMGQSPPGESFNEDGAGVVFYQGNRDFGFRSPTNRLWTVDPKRMAKAGDTLMSVRAPVGELNVATEPICIGRGLASLRSEVGRPSILFHTLKASSHLWEPFESGGTVFGSINGKELKNLQIPVCEGDLEELETRLSELDSVVDSAEVESQTLAVTRDALLPRLMSGELRVRDAERQVEGVL
ncbi:restriction endonuclease subunit S [Rhodococcus sp. NPDC049939]|uniref:restriction endonuclease subunit S n=1 Tax=Rhodococcus sp. NPDC049939 TaxID=3155511 RepID=UPI00340AA4E7